MKVSLSTVLEKCIWLLTVLLFSCFLIFDGYAWGKYVFFGASILILLMTAVIHDGMVRIRFDAFHGFFAAFIAYTALTSLWAIKASDATEKAITLVQIFACAVLLFVHYDRKDNIRSLLTAVMWSGYVVTLYAIAVYGLDAMLQSTQDIRLQNEFANVNAVAMSAAVSCMLQWQELTQKRNRWSAVLMIPAVILITATQSRKAFILLLAGVVGIYIMRTAQQKGIARKILKLCLYAIVGYVVMVLLFQLPIFEGSLARMQNLLNFWSNEGKVDHSAILRDDMMQLGLDTFRQHPLAGVGIGSPHILAGQYLDFDSYLHNNFVELLCGGGIIGFVLYYAMYVYLFVGLFKYRKADSEAFYVALIWLAMMLIMNYGMVTYYSKIQWYYLVIHFLNVNHLRKKHKEMTANEQNLAEEGV